MSHNSGGDHFGAGREARLIAARDRARSTPPNSQPRPPSAGSDSRVAGCATRESQPGSSLADLERAVEEAYQEWNEEKHETDGDSGYACRMAATIKRWYAARQAAQKDGCRTVVLSQKTMCAIREWDTFRFTAANESLTRRVFDLVIEDVLGTVLQEKNNG